MQQDDTLLWPGLYSPANKKSSNLNPVYRDLWRETQQTSQTIWALKWIFLLAIIRTVNVPLWKFYLYKTNISVWNYMINLKMWHLAGLLPSSRNDQITISISVTYQFLLSHTLLVSRLTNVLLLATLTFIVLKKLRSVSLDFDHSCKQQNGILI